MLLTILSELPNAPVETYEAAALYATVVKNDKVVLLSLINAAIWPFVILCLSTAGLVWFLQLAMEKGQLLRAWHYWIFKTFWYNGRGARIRKRAGFYVHWGNIPVKHLSKKRPFEDWPIARLYEYERVTNPVGAARNNPDHFIYWPIITERHPAKWWQRLYKPLGGCPYCMAPYVGTFFYVLIMPTMLPVAVAVLIWPLFVGLQYVCIEVIKRFTQYA